MGERVMKGRESGGEGGGHRRKRERERYTPDKTGSLDRVQRRGHHMAGHAWLPLHHYYDIADLLLHYTIPAYVCMYRRARRDNSEIIQHQYFQL